MNSATYGIFGPRGLLAKMETEVDCDNLAQKSLKKVSDTTLDENSIVPKCQELFEDDQYSNDVQGWSLTSKANPISVVPLRDLPPMEAAFSIEKISKTIFSLLDPKDLLRCRLVSSSWLRMATNDKLLKSNPHSILILYSLKWYDPADVLVKGRNKRLEDLTDFLDGLGSHPCIYSAILEMDTTIAQNNFFRFLDYYGFIVNSLKVKFETKENGNFFIYQKDSLLKFVTKLLTEQMPNLSTLTVEFEEDAKFAGDIDPQMLLSFKKGLYCAGKQNQSILYVKFGEEMPSEIIEAVCCLAPKLEKLKVNDPFGFFGKNLHRLYLLKTLEFIPSLKHWDDVDALKAFLNCDAQINLKKLTTSFYLVHDEPELWADLTSLMMKILERSSHSLEQLFLAPIYFLPGTVLPRMPKVKLISLISYGSVMPELNWLPQGISLASTFPNLHTVEFRGTFDAMRFSSLCKNEEVASVRSVVKAHSEENKMVLEKYFPNAFFS